MKKGLKAIGKATVYFGVYFLVQIIVSAIYSIVLSTKLTMEMMATGNELDMLLLEEQLMEAIMGEAMMMTFISGIVVLLLFWLVFLIRKKKLVKEVAIRPIPVKGILPVALMAAGFNVVTSVIVSCIPWPESWMESYITNASAIDNSLIAWITAVLMAPILEEIVFRGLIYTRLKKGLPMIAAAIITSLIFGTVHGTIIWAIYTFIFSMVLIWVFERFQSLTACIILHMAYNLSGMGMSLIPEEASVVVWILFAVSLVVVFFMYKQVVKVTEDIPKYKEAELEEKVSADVMTGEDISAEDVFKEEMTDGAVFVQDDTADEE